MFYSRLVAPHALTLCSAPCKRPRRCLRSVRLAELLPALRRPGTALPLSPSAPRQILFLDASHLPKEQSEKAV